MPLLLLQNQALTQQRRSPCSIALCVDSRGMEVERGGQPPAPTFCAELCRCLLQQRHSPRIVALRIHYPPQVAMDPQATLVRHFPPQDQRLLDKRRCPRKITLIECYIHQAIEDIGDSASVPEFSPHSETLLQQRRCPSVVALFAHPVPQLVKYVGHAATIAVFSEESQRLLLQRRAPRYSALLESYS